MSYDSYHRDAMKQVNRGYNMDEYKKNLEEKMRQEFNNMYQGKTLVEDGLTKVDGGYNKYGMKRADHYLMQNEDGELDNRYREEMGDSVKRLRDIGNTIGDDIDPRMQVQMGDAYSRMKDEAMSEGDTEWAAAQRLKQAGDIDRGMAQGLANSTNQLMMTGGMSGGASERMMANAGRNSMLQKQDAMSNISLQDMQRKDNLLSQVGQVEQGINEFNTNAFTNDYNRKADMLKLAGTVEQGLETSNTNALRQDLRDRNMAAQKLYEEDTKVKAAEYTADAQRNASSGSSCFLEGTEISMTDGTVMNIEDIEVGDEVSIGGVVTMTLQALSDHYYNYKGIKVTGSHAVYDNGEWKRVEDCEDAEYVDKSCKVYCIGNRYHRLLISGVEFADYYEDDDYGDITDEEALGRLNGVR